MVEDTDTTLDEIEEAFGAGVHHLVEAMTEDKDIEPYERRKEHHRDQVEAGGERAVLIYAADKVANLRDLRTLYANVGEGAASRFNAPLDVRVRLWEGDAEMIERVHPGTRARSAASLRARRVRGPARIHRVIVDCAHYEGGKRQHDGPIEIDEAASRCSNGDGGFAWVGLKEPSEEELERVGKAFGLHELALEDAMNAHQRPKLEDYGGSLFIVLRTARYDDAKEEVEFGEIHLFVGSDYVIAVRHGEASELTGPASASRSTRASWARAPAPSSGRSSTRSSTTTPRSSPASTTTSRRSRTRSSGSGPTRRSGSTS